MRPGVTRLLVVIPALAIGHLAVGEEAARVSPPATNTVIKYCLEPPNTFEIVGTDIKGIKKLSGLTKALRKHRALNPSAKYELVSEVKCPPDGAKAFIKAITDAGIKLEHFWAARSAIPPGTPTGPYGIGFVDILPRYQDAR
jgi:hypothetical protein